MMIFGRLLEGSFESECFGRVSDKVDSLMRDGIGTLEKFLNDADSNPTVCPGDQN